MIQDASHTSAANGLMERQEEGGDNQKMEENEIPLLPRSSSGTGTGSPSAAQTLGNIIVSIVGTGVLGLPFAFRIAGWLAGSLGVVIAGVSTYYCMQLLLQKNFGGEFSFSERKAVTSNIGGLPFAGGMAVFCFEGFGMTLALEASMRERGRFSKLLAQAFTGITLVYVMFGFFGYMAFGDETKDIVTLKLTQNWYSIAVQMGLCVALIFTFPIMVHPIHEIVEGKSKKSSLFQKLPCISDDDNSTTILGKFVIYINRAILIVALATIASFIPGFGAFTSLVGSTKLECSCSPVVLAQILQEYDIFRDGRECG